MPARRKDDVTPVRAPTETEATILNQRVFVLDDHAHACFLALLDAPPQPSAEARARLNRKAPWE
jgi:uncharacterized protein (DUF1778 family)